MDIDLRWVNQVMAFLAAANFVVSAMRTVLLFMSRGGRAARVHHRRADAPLRTRRAVTTA